MGDITLNHITKIEGHAHLDLDIKDNKVVRCELGSIEGSRYFEGLLKGRNFLEAHEITTRICGICSSAHNVAALIAMENALNVTPSSQTLQLRYLQIIGERFRSHATHLYFLALPDYLGVESALELAPMYKVEIARALRLMKLGNEMVTLTTGRVMHPVAPTIGGFLSVPSEDSLDEIYHKLIGSEDDILKTCDLFCSLKYPDFVRKDARFMSLVSDKEFGTAYGKIKIDKVEFEQSQFHDFISEYHESFSTANFVVKNNKSYSVGALSRFNNNFRKLSLSTKKYISKSSFKFPSNNPFHNIPAQALELIHYRDECLKILKKIIVQNEPPIKYKIHAGHGIGATEAPRGTLWHEYKIDEKGIITYANIVTPTAQFLRNLNEDIASYVNQLLVNGTSKEVIVQEIEKLIRSYDPCFSCSSHFLKVNWG